MIQNQLTLWREGSPASRGAQPGSDEARTMTATSGRRCLRLYDASPRATSSVRTLLASFLGAAAWSSNRCLLTWKAKATKRSRRLYFRLSHSTPPTSGRGCGSSPPVWMTPKTGDAKSATYQNRPDGTHSLTLCGQVRVFPTPSAQDAAPRTVGDGEPFVTRDGSVRRKNADGTSSNLGLTHTARLYPTPDAHDWKSGRGFDPSGRGHAPQLRHLANGSLNPEFVEWLMGFPAGWTALPDSATP